MKNAIRSVVLGSLSLSLLSGCVDDNYDYSANTPNPPAPSNAFHVYGPESTGEFQLWVADRNDNTAMVDSYGYVNQGNISTYPVDTSTLQGMLNVDTRTGNPARIFSLSANMLGINLSDNTVDGTLQFDLKVNRFNNQAGVVTVELASDSLVASPNSPVHKASVDISSAVHASLGSDTQNVKIPLSCFKDAGIDFSEALIAFSLESDKDINFNFGNVRIVSNSTNSNIDLQCDSIKPVSHVLDLNKAEDKEVFTPIVGADNTGWATTVGRWGAAQSYGFPNAWQTVHYPEAEPGQNSGMSFRLTEGELPKDLSRYINTGALEIEFEVEDYANHPTQIMNVRMETIAGMPNSQNVALAPGMGGDGPVKAIVPLKSLFTHANGRIDFNALKNVDRALILQPQPVQAPHTLEGMMYKVGSIRLVTIP